MERQQRNAGLGKTIDGRAVQAQRQRRRGGAAVELRRLRATTTTTGARQATVSEDGRRRGTEANVGIQHDEDLGQTARQLARRRGTPRRKASAEAFVVQRQLATHMG